MLRITIPENDLYDESTGTFISIHERTIQLEHSLLSISKWEAKWHIPYYDLKPKTFQQSLDYIRCMTLTQNVPSETYLGLTAELIEKIRAYQEDSMTATTISENPNKPKSRAKIITSEQIYSWMFANQIPLECEKWHINRLLMLIRVCNINNTPQKKMSKKDALAHTRAVNAARRKRK